MSAAVLLAVAWWGGQPRFSTCGACGMDATALLAKDCDVCRVPDKKHSGPTECRETGRFRFFQRHATVEMPWPIVQREAQKATCKRWPAAESTTDRYETKKGAQKFVGNFRNFG